MLLGKLEYEGVVEGNIILKCVAEVDPKIDRSRVSFRQGDALDLPADIGPFDIVLAVNLLDRLKTPRTFLNALKTIVKSNGIVVIATPFTWLPEFTEPENWIGGNIDEQGNEVGCFSALNDIMESNNFKLIDRVDGGIPFFMRDTKRKFHYCIAEAGVWHKQD